IISFELLEAVRWLSCLRQGGKVITNTQKISPMPVITGVAEYPEALEEKMISAGIDADAFNALSLAEEAGSPKAVNIVLMGRLSKYFPFVESAWLSAIKDSVPSKFLDLNIKAFTLGRNS
ncbi:MAG: 2-oxoacid:acceptor oxidoreductase family protein, partial [Oscillospiraceae bacterium]